MKDPKTIRIVFMGTPGFAAGVLEHLLQERYSIVGVITAPDKPAGRGLDLQESEVKKVAVKHSLKILQPEKLKNPDFLNELRALNAELQIVVAFRMLPEAVWKMPPMGTFNLHASLLPDYRGAAPINRAIMNGETKSGITTFFLEEKIDTGNILLREELTIGENETAGELHDRMMNSGAKLVARTIDGIANENLKPVPQSELTKGMLHEAPKIFKPDCKIDWNRTAKQIHDHVRGLSPYPSAWTILKKMSGEEIHLKIHKTSYRIFAHSFKPGTLLPGLDIATSDGAVKILELQSPGKKKMDVESWLRGTKLDGTEFFI
jgi:methionyl-tRNA formyltransferase